MARTTPDVAVPDLTGKLAVVTGASDGIGLGLAGFLFQQVEGGLLPALFAATSPGAKGGVMYGPSGFMHLRGAPAEQATYKPGLRQDDATKIWEVAERLAGVSVPA